jgi:hypothetical protein
MKNPQIAKKIQKLINSRSLLFLLMSCTDVTGGIIKTR